VDHASAGAGRGRGEERDSGARRGALVRLCALRAAGRAARPQPLASPADVDGLTVLGGDIGVDVPLAYSDGSVGTVPQASPRQAERQRRLQRQVARRQKGSKRRDKARRALARHAAARARRRLDAAHQETRRTLQRCDVLALEALRVKKMRASAKGTVDEPGRNCQRPMGRRSAHSTQGV
jgi:putative transposase